MKLLSLGLLLIALICNVNGHMWLRTPLSRGGVDNIGGTTSPCNGLNSGGVVNTYEVGQKVNFQFRVNQHGPNPFGFALLDSTNKAITLNATTGLLPTNIPNTVTAGPDGFNGVNVPVTIPNRLCDSCAIQLSGMGQASGSGTWYNCAAVRIVAAGTLAIPSPSSVTPDTASTSGGGTVHVKGTGFGLTSRTILCKFGDFVVTGSYVNSTLVNCPIPPYNNPGPSTIEISTDSQTFSSSGTLFTYTGNTIVPEITGISPASAPRGTNITITGKYFYSNTLQCKFNNATVVKAVWISTTQATCVVPANSMTSVALSVIISVDNSPYSEPSSVMVSEPTVAPSSTASWLATSALTWMVLVTIWGAFFATF